MPTWVPLSSLLTPSSSLNLPPPTPPAKGSPLGIISFAYGLVSLAGWGVLLLVAGLAHNNGTATESFNMSIGFIFMAGFALNFIAMVLGGIGIFKSKANTLSIIGAFLNGFALVGLVALIVIGLAAKSMN
jgi:hypothetical protein